MIIDYSDTWSHPYVIRDIDKVISEHMQKEMIVWAKGAGVDMIIIPQHYWLGFATEQDRSLFLLKMVDFFL